MTTTYKINFHSREWNHFGISRSLFKFVKDYIEILSDRYHIEYSAMESFVHTQQTGVKMLIELLEGENFKVTSWDLTYDNGELFSSGIEFHESEGLTAFLLEESDNKNDDDDDFL